MRVHFQGGVYYSPPRRVHTFLVHLHVHFFQLDRQVTLGPKGRNVVLERTYGSPEIVNDGVTIARDIALKDHEENVGVKLVQEVAQKSDNRCVARWI